jgi:hypothetical protein
MFKNSDRTPFAYSFSFEKVGVDFRNPLPVCQVASKQALLVSRLPFGRSAANFFNPVRITVKTIKTGAVYRPKPHNIRPL